jgi:hypothetical protein
VGFFPVFFPPEGCLGHTPVHTQPVPADPLQAVVFQQAQPPHLQEDAGLHPLLETVMGGGAGAELGRIQGLPLAARAQDEEDGIHADAIGRARASAAKAVRVHMFGK